MSKNIEQVQIHPKYRPDIDGLRALAVLLVVAFHAYPNSIGGGFIGVDIFFVISGFLISTIIFENLQANRFSFKDFYIRRVRRIFPPLILILFVCLVFGWFGLIPDEYAQLGKHVFGGASFSSNIILWNEAGYFDNSIDLKPLLHLWSLGVEEQFYLIWPFLLWAAWRLGFDILKTILFVGIGSFCLNVYMVNVNGIIDFYSPGTRFWELLAGATLSWLMLQKKIDLSNHGFLATLGSCLGLGFLIAGCVLITNSSAFPGWWALLPVLGAVFLIAVGPHSWINRKILSNPLLVWFGLISFPLYLWHWTLLAIWRTVEGATTHSYIRTRIVLLSVLLAWLTYRFIERPIRIKGRVKTIYLVLALALLGLIGAHIFGAGGYKSRESIKNVGITAAARDQFVGINYRYVKNNACRNNYRFEGNDTYGWWFCIKSSENKPTIILLGNSFANQLYPGFIANQELSRQTVLSIGACDLGKDLTDKTEVGNNNDPCGGDRPTHEKEFIEKLILNEGSIRYAILDGLRGVPDSDYIARIKKRVDFLEHAGVRVIIFTPHLRPGFNPKLCYTTPFRSIAKDCSFPIEEREAALKNFKPLIEVISKSNPNTLFFDQNEMYCKEGKCSYLLSGMPLHRDAAHISEYGSIKLQESFTVWAKKTIPEIFE